MPGSTAGENWLCARCARITDARSPITAHRSSPRMDAAGERRDAGGGATVDGSAASGTGGNRWQHVTRTGRRGWFATAPSARMQAGGARAGSRAEIAGAAVGVRG